MLLAGVRKNRESLLRRRESRDENFKHLANLFGERILVTTLDERGINVINIFAGDKRDRRLVYANLNRLKEILRDAGANPKDLYIEPDEEGANVAVSNRLLPTLEDTLVEINLSREVPWVLSQDKLTKLVARHMLAGEFETGHRILDMKNFL